MEIKELLSIVQQSNKFKEFNTKHPESYFVSAFFVLQNNQKDSENVYQINYCFQEEKMKKAAMFCLDKNKNITMKISEFMKKPSELELNEINQEIHLTLSEIEELVSGQLKNNKINQQPLKTIISLNLIENKETQSKELIWSLSCFFENLELVKVLVDDVSKEVRKFEKISLMNMIKKKGLS